MGNKAAELKERADFIPLIYAAINIESNKNQISANGSNGLNIPSRINPLLFGFPCHKNFSLLPTISAKSDFA